MNKKYELVPIKINNKFHGAMVIKSTSYYNVIVLFYKHFNSGITYATIYYTINKKYRIDNDKYYDFDYETYTILGNTPSIECNNIMISHDYEYITIDDIKKYLKYINIKEQTQYKISEQMYSIEYSNQFLQQILDNKSEITKLLIVTFICIILFILFIFYKTGVI